MPDLPFWSITKRSVGARLSMAQEALRAISSRESMACVHAPTVGYAVCKYHVPSVGSCDWFHSIHAHSPEADVAAASKQQNTITTKHGQRVITGVRVSGCADDRGPAFQS